MSNRSRIAALVALVVLAVAAFLILQPADEDSASTTTPAAMTPAGSAPNGDDAARDPAGDPAPAPALAPRRISVRDGRPAGGIAELKFRRGARIRFTVTADAPEGVHLHGYDVEKPVGPGQPARFSLPASIEGVFEIELERSGVELAQLTVEP